MGQFDGVRDTLNLGESYPASVANRRFISQSNGMTSTSEYGPIHSAALRRY
jgi:hypothetical protein